MWVKKCKGMEARGALSRAWSGFYACSPLPAEGADDGWPEVLCLKEWE